MSVLALGNGESRSSLDLNLLKQFTLIGCNAIVRDWPVDHLICVDRRMVKESLISPLCPGKVYTRPDWLKEFKLDSRVCSVPSLPYKSDLRPDDPFHWGSGPYAVLLAATLSDDIHLVGFDLWSKDKFINNIYKGTDNYNSKDYRSVDPRYWIHQISKVFTCFPDKYFTIYNDLSWNIPESWKLANVNFKTIDLLQRSV